MNPIDYKITILILGLNTNKNIFRCKGVSLLKHEKYLYNQCSHYTIVKVCIPLIDRISGCVAWSQGITTLHFQLLWTFWVTFQPKISVRSIPTTSALTQVSQWSHYVHTTNHHLCDSGERNGEQRRAKVSFLVEPWCKHWSCCGWQ